MEVILKEDVKGLGYKNDIIKVRNGYGRNFLIPRGLVVVANETNKKVYAEISKQRSFKEEKLRSDAVANLEKFNALTLTIGAKAGDSGKIFGSVSNIQIAEALKKAGYDVDRRNIEMNEDAIKSVGNYTAKVRLFKDVVANVNFEIVAE